MKKVITFCLVLMLSIGLIGCSQNNKKLSNEDINKLLIDEGYEFHFDLPYGTIYNANKNIDFTYQGKKENIYAITMRGEKGIIISEDEYGNCGLFSLNGVDEKMCQYKDAGKGKDILDDELYRLGITLDRLLEFIEYKFGD